MIKRSFVYLQLLLITVLAGCSLFQESLTLEQRTEVLIVQQNTNADLTQENKQTLKVISLNLAHGRKLSFNQLFVNEEAFRRNLLDIAEYLKKENADVVALQEADQASSWSGNFNHVEFLAEAAGYPWFVSAVHVDNSFGTYGTAILSKIPIENALGFTFAPTPPTTSKGYSLIQIGWDIDNESDNTQQNILIYIVSVHLDFSRKSKREAQLDELALTLATRDNAAIILGDFNSEWLSEEKVIQKFAEHGRYRAYQPEVDAFHSYSNKRLDWALVSTELEFTDYFVADEELSDHKPVVVQLRHFNAEDVAASNW